jgi:hypothetical protein
VSAVRVQAVMLVVVMVIVMKYCIVKLKNNFQSVQFLPKVCV